MNPKTAQLMSAATGALNKGDFAKVQKHCKQVLDLDPQEADAWFFLSIAAADGRQIREALKLVDKALLIQTDNPEYLSQKAKYHSQLHHYVEALEAANATFASKPESALVLDTLGVVYTRLGEYQRARDMFALAVAKSPDNVQFQFNLASAEQFLGNVEAATTAYSEAIKLKPDFARAHWALSELEKNRADARRFEHLKELLNAPQVSVEDELFLCHAISREYEKLNDYKLAIDYLQRGKTRRRANIKYSAEVDKRLFDSLIKAFPNAKAVLPSGVAQGEQAIFIVGMPRSGTTLVERILATHSQVHSLGELQEFARAVKLKSGSRTPNVFDEEVIKLGASARMYEIGAWYLSELVERRVDGMRFIDKMPLNFLCVGFIMAALPKAKILCVRRNPLDTCLSNFRQLFALNFSFYNYHYDLEDTARYYVQFDRLMQHWQYLFPERFYQLSYEALIDNPEFEARAALGYLELPWEPECLEFHKNTTAVATASTMQVRQPLYRSSVGRWRNYESQMQPAIRILKERDIEIE